MTKETIRQASEQRVKVAEKESIKFRRLEEVLGNSKTFTEELIACMKDGFSVLDTRGVHVNVNPAFCQMTGFTQEELIGTGPPHLYWPGEEYEKIETEFQKTLRGEFEDLELTFKRKNGERFPVIVSPSVVLGDNGSAISYFATVKDISERRKAEEALRKQEHDVGERIKELSCLYGISNLIDKHVDSLDKIFQGTVDLIPAAWQHPQITCARIVLDGQEFKTKDFIETPWIQSADITVHGEKTGVMEVCYREEKPEDYEGPFVKEERDLLDAIAERLGHTGERIQVEGALKEAHKELEAHTEHLEEVNAALRILLKQREDDKRELEENVLSNVRQLVSPYLEKLKNSQLDRSQTVTVSTLESNLNEIVSPFVSRLSSKFLNLTPTEIRVAELVKQGRTNKEIAELLSLSANTIKFHRFNVRSKLGLQNKKVNLRSYLMSLSK